MFVDFFSPYILLFLKTTVMGKNSTKFPLLGSDFSADKTKLWNRKTLLLFIGFLAISIAGMIYGGDMTSLAARERGNSKETIQLDDPEIVVSEVGVVASEDRRCSKIGAEILRQGGHAVDAAVATALCVGVVNPVASGIGGGAFMVVKSSSGPKAQAFDMRETAPLAASKNMYDNNINEKYSGPLSIGVPGEIAGLYEAWLQHGRLPWKSLFQPAIKLAKDGFVVLPYLGWAIDYSDKKIRNDPGLRDVFAPDGKLLKIGDTCYNVKLAKSLEEIAEIGPSAFYNGTVGEKLVRDVQKAGGLLTMDDLKNYKTVIGDAMSANVTGYTIHGMPPPSGGTLGLAMVLNILDSYGTPDAAKGDLGLHRIIEALKHMFAIRMNLGDPEFVNVETYVSKMLSPSHAAQIHQKIVDNTTFPPEYYMGRWSQLREHGTSHFCIVDSERNSVSMTSTVNYGFGAGFLSPSTGIVLNNEMGDFSAPTEVNPDKLPPAPANYIEPKKRPLSSMAPIIVTKDDQLVGVLGGSGGIDIIPAVVQVFINHFVLGIEPLTAVKRARIYHTLIPNTVLYENWTVYNGDHIELAEQTKASLIEKGHELKTVHQPGGAMVQLVVQSLEKQVVRDQKTGRDSDKNRIFHGILTAVSDPRKDGRPAAV